MSEYDYDDRGHHRGPSTRYRDREPEYVSETTYIQRGPGRPSNELVYRGRDDSIEDIPRDFPPVAEYRRSSQRIREDIPPRRRPARQDDRYYDDDYYSDHGPPRGGFGVAARDRRQNEYYNDRADYYSDDYGDRPRRDRRKSTVEKTLEDLGLGGAVGALLGKSRSKSRSGNGRQRSYDDYDDRDDRSRNGDPSKDSKAKWQQAAKAAVLSGVVEAVRSRNQPGGWTGAKGQRVATAALGAAGIDGLLDRNPEEKSKRHIIESVVGGLAANRIANGPTSRSGSRGRSRSRSRSRSTGGGLRARSRSLFRSISRGGRSRGRSDSYSRSPSPDRARSKSRGRGLAELAAAGGVVAAGKALYDRVRSKSRGRARSASVGSEDSYVPARRQRYAADRGAPPDTDDGPRGRAEGSTTGGDLIRTEGQKRASSSDSVSTTDLENQRKKTRGKELLTAGLATVATIHAAHGVYSSMQASEARRKLVSEGEMSPDEARKRKSKNMLQDAAAVGIAALGLKSAFAEWKDMNEQRHEVHEIEDRRRKRRKAREKREREARFRESEARRQYYSQGANNMGNYSGPSSYNDGNPYSNLPPPPMGGSYR